LGHIQKHVLHGFKGSWQHAFYKNKWERSTGGTRKKALFTSYTNVPLNLAAVEVHAADPIHPHRLHHPGHVRGGNRHARAVLAVLPGVTAHTEGKEEASEATTHRRIR
jgi:hypothetical protein